MKHALRQLHYAKDGEPVHVTPGVLAEEAYGVKTTSRDMIKFIEANIDPSVLDRTLQSAIESTHMGHYRIGAMYQGLG
ncbi:hypothetical protein [Rhizobium sp. AU243]|uniref:hypothetical protein n=1 Tax=Rhizobium sp. AU243 TaxID=2303425 RepID=UPI0010CBEBCC|nr:hypothetical protein [Rhizobium sp. AU243]TKV70447.1 hypothetical protein D0C28_26875 [Rhizobium sp. AU243]